MVEVVPGGVSCRHEERGQGGRSSRDTPDLWRSVLQHVVYLSGSAWVAGGGVLLHDGVVVVVVVVVVIVRVLSLGQGVWHVEGCCSMMGWWWWWWW